jgi:hypothetical protein
MSAARDLYKLTFEISPIMLTNGIATFMPGGMLPIISLTQSVDFVAGVLSGGGPATLDEYFAHFNPAPGTALISQKIATSPFANQSVAANAAITDPLPISMHMLVPAKAPGGYAVKLATMLALTAALKAHNALGGTFIVATPSYFFTDCVMLDLRDISSAESKQPQYRWQWDFVAPLISLQQAQQVQNAAMSKITGGLPTDGALTGLGQTVNVPPSLAGMSTVPAASSVGAAGVAPLVPVTSSPLPALG